MIDMSSIESLVPEHLGIIRSKLKNTMSDLTVSSPCYRIWN